MEMMKNKTLKTYVSEEEEEPHKTLNGALSNPKISPLLFL